MSENPKFSDVWEKFDVIDTIKSCSDNRCPIRSDKYVIFRKKELGTIQKCIEKSAQAHYLKQLEYLKKEVDESIKKEDLPEVRKTSQIAIDKSRVPSLAKSPIRVENKIAAPVSKPVVPQAATTPVSRVEIALKPPEKVLKILDTRGLSKESSLKTPREVSERPNSKVQVISGQNSVKQGVPSPIPSKIPSKVVSLVPTRNPSPPGRSTPIAGSTRPSSQVHVVGPVSPRKQSLPPPMNPNKTATKDSSFFQLMEKILNNPTLQKPQEIQTPLSKPSRNISSPVQIRPVSSRTGGFEISSFHIRIPDQPFDREEIKRIRDFEKIKQAVMKSRGVVVVADVDEESSTKLENASKNYGKFSTVRPTLSEIGGVPRRLQNTTVPQPRVPTYGKNPGLASVAPKIVRSVNDSLNIPEARSSMKGKPSASGNLSPLPQFGLGKRQANHSFDESKLRSPPQSASKPKLGNLLNPLSKGGKSSATRDPAPVGIGSTSKQRPVLNADDWTLAATSRGDTPRSLETRYQSAANNSAEKRSARRLN